MLTKVNKLTWTDAKHIFGAIGVIITMLLDIVMIIGLLSEWDDTKRWFRKA